MIRVARAVLKLIESVRRVDPLEWQIGDFGALQNLTDAIRGATIVVEHVDVVGHQRAAILHAPSPCGALIFDVPSPNTPSAELALAVTITEQVTQVIGSSLTPREKREVESSQAQE